MKKYFIFLAAVLVYLASFAGLSHAATMDFVFLTGDGGDLSDYYSLEVTEGTGGAIDFTFYNTGLSGSITEFYFYDSTGAFTPASSTITQSTGVNIVDDSGVTPIHLPGFDATGYTLTYWGDVDQITADGVAPNEWVTFSLTLGIDFATAWSYLESGQVVVGIHSSAQPEESSSYKATPTPVPASLLLLGSGLFGVGVFRRKKTK